MEACMKRVLILLLFVLVVGCGEKRLGPDSDWECPSCHQDIDLFAPKCLNCGEVFEDDEEHGVHSWSPDENGELFLEGHWPVKRKN
jgi:predicted amidophosphoribosyltransferase